MRACGRKFDPLTVDAEMRSHRTLEVNVKRINCSDWTVKFLKVLENSSYHLTMLVVMNI